jgi:hypothetical protein
MRIPLKIIVAVIALRAIVVLVLRQVYRGQPPVHLPPETCDATLWKDVYQPERLQAIEACTAVEGRVVTSWQANDGDRHIRLEVENRSLLNIFNLFHGHGDLVVELI